MTLAVFNGSPRGKKSNSSILSEHFLAGYRAHKKDAKVIYSYLMHTKEREDQHESYQAADNVIIIFPLYTDCMPGIVKEFFEQIHSLPHTGVKNIGFIVQSGFPEANHSLAVERYLEKFCQKLGHKYMGTIIKGGVEGIQVMPTYMTRSLFQNFIQLGKHFAEQGNFSPTLSKKLRSPIKMNIMRRFAFGLMSVLGFSNFYWNSQLKKNKVWHRRFDKPYASS